MIIWPEGRGEKGWVGVKTLVAPLVALMVNTGTVKLLNAVLDYLADKKFYLSCFRWKPNQEMYQCTCTLCHSPSKMAPHLNIYKSYRKGKSVALKCKPFSRNFNEIFQFLTEFNLSNCEISPRRWDKFKNCICSTYFSLFIFKLLNCT